MFELYSNDQEDCMEIWDRIYYIKYVLSFLKLNVYL